MDEAYRFELARGSKPLHSSIAEHLAAAVASGSLAPGAQLPPERQLAATLGVSRMTVRHALGELERDGLVRRVVGRSGGTFISERAGEGTVTGAGGISAALRREAGASHVELVSVDIEPAGKRAAVALSLERNERVAVIVRLRLAGGKPLAVERTSVPTRLFPDIENMDLAGSLYDLMDVGFGLRPVRAVERLETAEARPSDARTIGAKRGSPVLLVERIGYAADGTPVEFGRDRFRGDRTLLTMESLGVME